MSHEIAGELMPPRRKQIDKPGCGLLIAMVVAAWAVEFLDVALPIDLDRFGIYPRQLKGIPGIFLSPWLHGDWSHLIANTLTFIGLGYVVLLAEGRRFISITLSLVVASGLGTWMIGRATNSMGGDVVHIGASGLIYGYFGYILGRAIWERRASWMVIGIVVGIIYGGMIWGVLPAKGFVSWEAHLTGLLAGVWLGREHAVAR